MKLNRDIYMLKLNFKSHSDRKLVITCYRPNYFFKLLASYSNNLDQKHESSRQLMTELQWPRHTELLTIIFIIIIFYSRIHSYRQ